MIFCVFQSLLSEDESLFIITESLGSKNLLSLVRFNLSLAFGYKLRKLVLSTEQIIKSFIVYYLIPALIIIRYFSIKFKVLVIQAYHCLIRILYNIHNLRTSCHISIFKMMPINISRKYSFSEWSCDWCLNAKYQFFGQNLPSSIFFSILGYAQICSCTVF